MEGNYFTYRTHPGSCDAGATVLNTNSDLEKKIEEVANLKKHPIAKSNCELWTPADLEGHVGTVSSKGYLNDL